MKLNETLLEDVKIMLEVGDIPMLLGEPGIGKSSWLENLATLLHTKCFTVPVNQLADKADLTGARLVPTEKNGEYKQKFYPHAIIFDAIEYAKENPRETPILFLDELNRTTPDVTSAALSIPTSRSIGNAKIPDNLRIVAAGNDRGNVTSLDKASISRFVPIHVEPDLNTFLAHNQDLNPFILNTLKAHPETLYCETIRVAATSNNDDDNDNFDDTIIDEILDDEDSMAQITTPRTITKLSEALNKYSNNQLVSRLADTYLREDEEISYLQELLEGYTGKTQFTSYLLLEIANNIMTVNNQSAVTTVGKPACYVTMKNCADMNSLSDCIATMSDNDKSGCLLYAIYEKEDNEVFIKALASEVTSLTPDDTKTLMSLSASDKLDEDNVRTLLNTNQPIAIALNVILSV